MSAEPITVPADEPVVIPTLESAHHAFVQALTDEDGYRISPPCEQAPDMWFPEVGENAREARQHCVDLCPAVTQCGILALVAGERLGIWGGVAAISLARMSPEERLAQVITWTVEP
ncbi:hypothetical protein SEA_VALENTINIPUFF_92 [Microbacterium phage ValentiniPuff]|uniref:4Fe-4S Wbl-type domain-containing protein n=1 Tax=Microbacterium phage ValentiniPuff TaxID=2315705 RepID=A0A386KSQ9_9CAUD|nr:hypothetical protein SEA_VALENTINIPUFF_92 [Microbacterium phage ValentiniPuff]